MVYTHVGMIQNSIFLNYKIWNKTDPKHFEQNILSQN